MTPAPITPADLLACLAVGALGGVCLTVAAYHLRDWLRARRAETILRKSTLFRYRA